MADDADRASQDTQVLKDADGAVTCSSYPRRTRDAQRNPGDENSRKN
jgi:hypothetical protein